MVFWLVNARGCHHETIYNIKVLKEDFFLPEQLQKEKFDISWTCSVNRFKPEKKICDAL